MESSSKIRYQPDESEPLAVEIDKPIMAVRGWNLAFPLIGPAYILTSLAHYYHWHGPVNRTSRPDFASKNGFWAVKADRLHGLIHVWDPAIIGIVELSGEVVEHDIGYRAQIVTIRHLHERHAQLLHPDHSAELAAIYQCEVATTMEDFNQAVYDMVVCQDD